MYFEDLKVGMETSLEETEIKKEDMLDFAFKYDTIPIHTDEEYAKNTIFKGLIAPGVFSFMLMWKEYLKTDFVGDELIAGKSTKIEWIKPVYPGDILHGRAYISLLTSRNEKNGIAEITLDLYNQRNELVIRDVTESIVKKRNKA